MERRPIGSAASWMVRPPASARTVRPPVGRVSCATGMAARLATARKLADCEFGDRPDGRLSLRTRQRGANQRAVDRSVVLIGHRCLRRRNRRGLGRGGRSGGRGWVTDGLLDGGSGLVATGREIGSDLCRAREHFLEQRGRFLPLPASHGELRGPVGMLSVAGGAACLFDAILDHRDHGVIGDASLARTVVVQDISQPKPALLHSLPRKNLRRDSGLRAEPSAVPPLCYAERQANKPATEAYA